MESHPDGSTATRGGSVEPWLFDFSPLGHRLWWAALVLMLINDNLLKGGGLAPGWLTGKLSDFAFLIVAPVLLTTLLPLRLRGRRWLAFAAVTAVYVAADLSPAASDAVVALAARLGLRWRLWPDVTDLIALLVLPASWRIAGVRGRRPLYRPRTVAQAAGLVVGIFACLATSEDHGLPHYPFLVNSTNAPRTLSVTWVLRKVGCDDDLTVLAGTLTSADLDDVRTVTLAQGQVAALDDAPAPGAPVAGVCQNHPSNQDGDSNCIATVVAVENGPAVVVSASRIRHERSEALTAIDQCWETAPTPSTCAPTMSTTEDPGPDALSLSESAGWLTFHAGAKLKMATIDMAAVAGRVPSAPGCRDLRTQLHTLLDGATACATDADCQVLTVNLGIPGGGICLVDVNASVSADLVSKQKAAWTNQCEVDSTFTCTKSGHPAVCTGGRCGELCAGAIVPICPPSCDSLGLREADRCISGSGDHCLDSDQRLCECAEARSGSGAWVITCAPQAEIPGCPIRCVPRPTLDAGPKVDTRPVPVDLAPAALDTHAVDSAATAIDGNGG